MISFIVIGKNEEKKLGLCFSSIIKTIEVNSLFESEIIFVDSNSTDKSIEIARSFSNIKIFQITGKCNAAMGRNIGALESKGDILCFLDGDMEIDPDFIPAILRNNKLVYPFVSGKLKNIFYNNFDDKIIIDSNIWPEITEDKYFNTTGGFFIIEKGIWNQMGGMKTKYYINEDYDIGLRLAKKGIRLLRKNLLMVTHHTIDYQSKSRIWKRLFSGNLLYSTSVITRDHLFDKSAYKMILRNNYSLIILFFSIPLIFVNPWIISYYFLVAALRAIFRSKIKGRISVFGLFFSRILLDFYSLIGLFFFFPKELEQQYIEIKN